MRRLLSSLAAASLLAGACVTKKEVRVEGVVPLRVAVLPFDNETVDMAGPEQLRRLVFEGVSSRGYSPQALAETDELLKGLGITDGGQLKAYAPKDLAAKLGVEGLFYGTLERFATQNVGVALRRIVELRLELMDSSGTRVWDGSGKGTFNRVALKKGEARKLFIEGIAERAAANALRVPLLRESQIAVEKLLKGMPRRY